MQITITATVKFASARTNVHCGNQSKLFFFFDDTTPCLNASQNIEPLSMIYLTALMVRFLI